MLEPTTSGPSRVPVARSLLVQMLIAYVALTGIWYVLGRSVMASDAIVGVDERTAERLASDRTESMNDLTVWGSMLSDTLVKIVATAVLAGLAVAIWRRWRDGLMLALPLILEASVFITVTWLIGRPRPDVERLEGSPVNSSFPSGHVAAAAAYSAAVVVVSWHSASAWLRGATVALVAVIVAAVGYSRMYRGMHFLSDVVTGAALGVAAVVVTWWILRRTGVAPATEPATEPLDDTEPAVSLQAAHAPAEVWS